MSRTYQVPNRDKRDLTPEEMLSDTRGEIAARLEKPIAQWHFAVFGWLLAIGVVVLFARSALLAVLHYETYARIAEANRTETVPLPAFRGIIFDRLGNALTRNVPVLDLLTDPATLPADAVQRANTAMRLSNLLALDEEKKAAVVSRLSATSQKSVLLIERLDARSAAVFEARRSEFSGVILRVTPGRVYEEGEALYHVLGNVGRVDADDIQKGYLASDFAGRTGIEASQESVLKGLRGQETFEVDARGNALGVLSRTEPQEGEHLVLSFEKSLQEAAYQALKQAVRARRSPGGAVVAIDARNGAVLALASYPSVDANELAAGLAKERYNELSRDPGHPFFNRAIAARYPAGSTIKPLMAVAALAESVVAPSTVIEDRGEITVPDIYNPAIVYTFRGYAALGPVNVLSAIALSSDVYFYTVGGGYGSVEGLGIERIAAYMQKFGFGEMLNIDISGENKGLVPTPEYKERVRKEKWRVGDTYNVSIGQGDVGVTMLQLAAATAAIANGGTLWRPRLVLRTVDADMNTLRVFVPQALRTNIADPAIFETVRKGMRGTVTYGTAKLLQQLPVAAAAKTGTAETGKRSAPHSLVTAFAPYENPEIVLAVIVEKAGEGSEVAVPLAREILAEYFGGTSNQ